ncbi:MAG: hypothetical protein A2149_00350 [Candidatus Schekmanbacteria bacterium RBG_16_38_11]|uniref:Diguanylate cyclase response regulator n=1 Tax=Candidatus Schekmanbacteria bacterium RBG_16_38_11 TaxID=1817880 RepID=A0A1F7RYR2_9BACT|nr:MAG: hypothetical protein A2149_00350 [Candidatus Schekmanbacteria bacterium RBG_16_38_11]
MMDKDSLNGAASSEKESKETEDEKPVPVKILIVDDEEILRNMLTDVLTEEGYQVSQAPNGEEAVNMLKENYFEIVLTDIMMPGLDGIGVLRAAKEIEPGSDIIVMTGYASVETAIESIRLGASDYITKPFNIDQIKIVIARTIQRRVLERKAQEGEFYKEISKIDTITNLFNHKTFQQLFEAEVGRAKRHNNPLSLLILDIDNFTIYNETNGYPMGDFVLKEIATILTDSCRNHDLVARYGGDEFAVIVPGQGKEETALIARRFKKNVEESKFEKEEVLPGKCLTVSVSLVTFPEDSSSKRELLEKAEETLKKAKSKGVNQLGICGRE